MTEYKNICYQNKDPISWGEEQFTDHFDPIIWPFTICRTWHEKSLVWSLVIDTKQGLASDLILVFLIQELVEVGEALLGGAVVIVPPVTHKILLRENSSVGTQKTVDLARVGLAHVEHL